jgi:hypothetical protein
LYLFTLQIENIVLSWLYNLYFGEQDGIIVSYDGEGAE